ncbi:XRE family transcriptional regulator [Candidatus Roizmanbacteria bacterium CG_4_9_14_3_um_filter_33_18]|uniref:XRE family transcriptional regulator n=1 Tax=Candidatus Roizmanbacteria bacterium CG_4_9_14_3_um_filter_33_18 TaxID=1974841 RepID=A0A2M7XYB6_9BACT|nr:MAG: XRE family transcriptional regulator [Candidatus Roizmanbacteria bacterium CG_4_9_14_3_um_filter_33_18]
MVGYKRLTDILGYIKLLFNVRENFFYEKLGNVILRLRENKKLTQEQLCFLCEINRSYLFKIEKGLTNPSIKTLSKICKTLRIKIRDLIKKI